MHRIAKSSDRVVYADAFRFRLPWWKRIIDILVSLTACLLLSPLLIVVALLIKLDSKGPVFYRSRRVGANYRIFSMYKFRTMSTQADQLLKAMASQNIYGDTTAVDPAGPESDSSEKLLCEACQQQATSCQRLLFDKDRFVCERQYLLSNEGAVKFLKFRNDPRVTRLGRFLRNSSIDELPQLINILIGDMSLVGNRPLPLYEAEKLTTNYSVKRFSGPSGLTGLWQVEKRGRGEEFMNEQERIDLDIEYAETFSFQKDMAIIYKTIFSLWQKENV